MLAPFLLLRFLADRPTMVSGHAGAEAGGKIYVVGGMGEPRQDGFFSTLWQVDPANGKWTAMRDIKVPRAMAGGAYVDGSIYIAGGFDRSNNGLASVERFDLRSEKWF